MLDRQSYTDLKPRTATAPAKTGVSKTSQLIALALVLIATAVAIWLLVRRHHAALRDEDEG